MTRRREAPCRP